MPIQDKDSGTDPLPAAKLAQTTASPVCQDEMDRLKCHNAAMRRLVTAVQELSLAWSLESVMGVVRKAARELTGADGATFVLKEGEKCYYADRSSMERATISHVSLHQRVGHVERKKRRC